MRRILIALFCALALATGTFAADAEVTSLSAEATVQEDGICQVTLTAQVSFSTAQTRLLIPLGNGAKDITLSGWQYEKTEVDGVTCLELANSTGFSGTQQFVCSYTLPCQAENAGEGQRFRLRLPETGWELPIAACTWKLTFPTEVTSVPEWVSGYYGDVVDNYLDIQVVENTVTARTTAAMKDHETMTITLQFPAETFDLRNQPGKTTSLDQILFFLLLALALLYWFFALRYRLVLPRPQQSIGMEATAGEIPCQLMGAAPDAAGILAHWGNLGYVAIRRNSRGRVLLYKQMEMGNERKPAERRFFRALFRGSDLCDAGSIRFRNAVKAMEKPMRSGWQRRMFQGGNPYLLRGLGAAAGLFASLMTFDSLLPATGGRWVWLPILTLLGVVLCALVQLAVCSLFRRKKLARLILGGGAGIALLLLAHFAGTLGIMLLNILLQGFCGLVTLPGGRRSPAGQDRLRRLLGLRRFLKKADKASLQRLSQMDPQYFYRMLPFAEAMGVGRAFAKRAECLRLEPCSWLSGRAGTPRTATAFYQLYAEICAQLRGERTRSAPAPTRQAQPAGTRRTQLQPVAPAPKPKRPHRREEYEFDE